MKVLQVHGKDAPQDGRAISTSHLHHGLLKAGTDSRLLGSQLIQLTCVMMRRSPLAARLLSCATLRLSAVHGVGAFHITCLPVLQETAVVNFHGTQRQRLRCLAPPALTAAKTAVMAVRAMWPLTGYVLHRRALHSDPPPGEVCDAHAAS